MLELYINCKSDLNKSIEVINRTVIKLISSYQRFLHFNLAEINLQEAHYH